MLLVAVLEQHVAVVVMTAAAATPLAELVGASGGFGRWSVKIVGEPKEKQYSYVWDGKSITGIIFTVKLVSEDQSQY